MVPDVLVPRKSLSNVVVRHRRGEHVHGRRWSVTWAEGIGTLGLHHSISLFDATLVHLWQLTLVVHHFVMAHADVTAVGQGGLGKHCFKAMPHRLAALPRKRVV